MPKFAKRHYEAIAQAMQQCKPNAPANAPERVQWNTVCYQLVLTFKTDNHAFQTDRFLAACEPDANVRARS